MRVCVCDPLVSPPLVQHAWAPLQPFKRQSLPPLLPSQPPCSPLFLTAAAHLILKVFPQHQSNETEHLGVMSYCGGIQEHTQSGKHTKNNHTINTLTLNCLCNTQTQIIFHTQKKGVKTNIWCWIQFSTERQIVFVFILARVKRERKQLSNKL